MVGTFKGPAFLFLAIVGVLLGYEVLAESDLQTFHLLRDYHEWAIRIWLVIVALEVSYLLSHLLQALMLWYVDNIADRTVTDLDEKLIPQVRRVTPIFVYAIGGLMALDFLGVSITPLVAGLGIGGLAVALAIQPTLSSFLSGTYLITEGELNEGDFIELENGPSGFVIDVGWRSTKIRDRFNNLIMIPNSKMIESVMTNYYSQSRVMTVRGLLRHQLRLRSQARREGRAGGRRRCEGRCGRGSGRLRASHLLHRVRRLEHRLRPAPPGG